MNILSYIPPFIAIILILAGVPAFIELYKTTHDLNTSIVFTLVYELIVLVGSFMTKVWQRLEGKWTERLAEKIDKAFQGFFSHYKRRYLEFVIYQHRNFDVKGLTTQGPYNLELDKVFVQLTIDPTPYHQTSSNLVKANLQDVKPGSHTIWEYLNSKPMAGQSFAIIGSPGSGKTTLLKYIALTLSANTISRIRAGAPNLLPILLFLRDHAEGIKSDPEIKLITLIEQQFTRRQTPLPSSDWLVDELNAGNCLVMFDGLDEVADSISRKAVVAWVEKCMIAFGKNRFIISSRPYGYRSNPLANVTVLEVRPFTSKQIEQFVNNWYLANEIMSSQKYDAGIRADALLGADDLLNRIRSTPALTELAVNPLLLTMIATVHRYRSALPGRRVELYAEICDVLLGKRQEARGIVLDLTPSQKQRILRPLAYHMMSQQKREINVSESTAIIVDVLAAVSPNISSEDFLRDVENTSGLLLERESGVYGFAHLTFQEYLAASHILENRLEIELINHVGNSWWHEVIRLYCAQTDASSVITACLNVNSLTSLILAIQCIKEAREIKPSVRQYFQTTIELGAEDPNPERRSVIADALITLRLSIPDDKN